MSFRLLQHDIKYKDEVVRKGKATMPKGKWAAATDLTELNGVVLGAVLGKKIVKNFEGNSKMFVTYISPYFQIPICCLRADCSASLYSPTYGQSLKFS